MCGPWKSHVINMNEKSGNRGMNIGKNPWNNLRFEWYY